jgi:glycosyltransferase involved in cell wall biosynthesis
MTLQRVLVLAPTRRAASETFVRANLAGLPFATTAYFGDERPLGQPWRLVYGVAVLMSKVLTRLGWLRLAGWPAAVVTKLLVRRHQPDLLLVEFGFHALRVMEAAAECQIPLVVHFRGSDLSAWTKFGAQKMRYRRLMRIASGAIVKSQPMRQTLLDLGMESERILISASGANAQLFHSSAPGSAPPVFLAVGRFVDKKGPLFTIRAFAQLVGHHPRTDLALWMVGEGPLQQQAKALVRELGLESVVRFWGAQPQQKVAELMREARGFVQHSVVAPDGDSEGNPVAVMEAQLSGLPVVATRHAGIPEVVRHGESGWLVAEADVAGMAAGLLRLVEDPGLAQRWGQAGRRRIQERFTIDHHLRDVAQFLRGISPRSRFQTSDR